MTLVSFLETGAVTDSYRGATGYVSIIVQSPIMTSGKQNLLHFSVLLVINRIRLQLPSGDESVGEGHGIGTALGIFDKTSGGWTSGLRKAGVPQKGVGV